MTNPDRLDISNGASGKREKQEGKCGVSLLVLAVTIPALYVFHLAGWRRTYVVGAVIALYLNIFVLIAQFFMKIPALKALAPTQSEPPFLGTQVVVMLIFIVPGVLAARRF